MEKICAAMEVLIAAAILINYQLINVITFFVYFPAAPEHQKQKCFSDNHCGRHCWASVDND